MRFEFENGVEFGDRGVGLALLDQRERQVIARLKVVRVEFYARAQGFNSSVKILVCHKGIAERGLNVGELRIQLRGNLQFVDRLAQSAQLLQRQTEVVMRFDVI